MLCALHPAGVRDVAGATKADATSMWSSEARTMVKYWKGKVRRKRRAQFVYLTALGINAALAFQSLGGRGPFYITKTLETELGVWKKYSLPIHQEFTPVTTHSGETCILLPCHLFLPATWSITCARPLSPGTESRVVDPGAARGTSGAKPQVTPKLVTDRRPHLADDHINLYSAGWRRTGADRVGCLRV